MSGVVRLHGGGARRGINKHRGTSGKCSLLDRLSRCSSEKREDRDRWRAQAENNRKNNGHDHRSWWLRLTGGDTGQRIAAASSPITESAPTSRGNPALGSRHSARPEDYLNKRHLTEIESGKRNERPDASDHNFSRYRWHWMRPANTPLRGVGAGTRSRAVS